MAITVHLQTLSDFGGGGEIVPLNTPLHKMLKSLDKQTPSHTTNELTEISLKII